MKVHYSSKSDGWETPQDFFDDLDKEFGFTLDPCATHENAKCDVYFTKEFGGSKTPAPFPSAVIVFGREKKGVSNEDIEDIKMCEILARHRV